MRLSVHLAAAALLLYSAGTSPIGAADTGQKTMVEIVGLSAQYANGRYGAFSESMSVGSTLSVGETGRAYVAYGRVDDAAGFTLEDLCPDGAATIGPNDDPATVRDRVFKERDPAHYWYFSYKVLPAGVGKIDLDLTWEHWSQVGTGGPVRVGGDTRLIEIRDGERSVVDGVSLDSPAGNTCVGVQLAVTARAFADSASRYELLRYDVWFQHEDASGGITRRHYEGIGRQNEEVYFLAEPMRFTVPDARAANGASYDAIIELSGSVHGRIQANGSIQVRLKVDRWTDVEEHGEPRRGGCGDGGEKVFTLQPGETVRMTLPVPGGSNAIDQTETVNGAVTGKYRVKVDNATFYKGSQDSIILTVDRVH